MSDPVPCPCATRLGRGASGEDNHVLQVRSAPPPGVWRVTHTHVFPYPSIRTTGCSYRANASLKS
eukprot:6106481-Prymnesium_polylepis.1